MGEEVLDILGITLAAQGGLVEARASFRCRRKPDIPPELLSLGCVFVGGALMGRPPRLKLPEAPLAEGTGSLTPRTAGSTMGPNRRSSVVSTLA